MKTRIFVVDENPRARSALTALINAEADFEICGDSGAGATGLSRILATKPDAVIVDIFAPDGSGLELVRRLKRHELAAFVIGYSDNAEADSGATALQEGALGYVSKEDSVVRLLLAIRNVRAIQMLSTTVPGAAPPWKISPRTSPAAWRAA
jgi:DNA-binding NarL/FixJ family response regulator